MALLYKRAVAVTVDTLRMTGQRMAFRVLHTNKAEPNTCEVSIYNAPAVLRAEVQGSRSVGVTIEAGYGKDLQQLFSGDLRRAFSTKQGIDWVTTLRGGDGEVAMRTARVNESFAPGTPIRTVVERVARRLGVNLGDAISRIGEGSHRQSLTEYVNGTVLSGSAKTLLEQLLGDLDLEYSVVDGTLQVLPRGQATNATAILLTPRTGLIGSPEAGDKGLVKLRSLLQPSIRPGRKVKVESAILNGFYRVETATHVGDTHSAAWHTEIEGRPL